MPAVRTAGMRPAVRFVPPLLKRTRPHIIRIPSHQGAVAMTKTSTNRARAALALLGALLVLAGASPGTRAADPAAGERHFLYVAAPGIRNYLEFGGAGVLVFDADHDYAFVKRIETPASQKPQPENVKGVCASAA